MATRGLRYSRRRPRRLLIAAALLIILVVLPTFVGILAADSHRFDPLRAADVYLRGFDTLRTSGLAAAPLALIFVLCLLGGKRQAVNRQFLNQSARDRRHAVEGLRVLLVVGGGASVILGGFAGLCALLLAIRPDIALAHPNPLSLQLAAPCLLLGGLAYALGRWNRPA